MKCGRAVGVLTVALFAGLAAACGAPDDESAMEGAAVDVWTLGEAELRIGSVDDAVYAFPRVIGLDVGPDGRIYTRHSGEAFIRRWTRDGVPIDTIGGEGQGPGEFQRVSSMGFFGNDSLWALDSGSGYRVSYFSLDGSFLSSVLPTVDIGSTDGDDLPPRPMAALRDGTLLAEAPGFSHLIATGELSASRMARVSTDGTELAHVWDRPWRPTDLLALLSPDGPGGTFGTQPFPDGYLRQWTGEAIVALDRRAYGGEGPAVVQLTWIDLDGDTVRHAAVPYDPAPLPEEAVDSAARATAERMLDFMRRMDPGATLLAVTARIREATYAPDFLPPVEGMVVADDRSVWLRRMALGGDTRRWWIVGPEGEVKGEAVLPTSIRILAIEAGTVWGEETDDFDASYIVRYPLVLE